MASFSSCNRVSITSFFFARLHYKYTFLIFVRLFSSELSNSCFDLFPRTQSYQLVFFKTCSYPLCVLYFHWWVSAGSRSQAAATSLIHSVVYIWTYLRCLPPPMDYSLYVPPLVRAMIGIWTYFRWEDSLLSPRRLRPMVYIWTYLRWEIHLLNWCTCTQYHSGKFTLF